MSSYIEITPRDPFIARDGRPFNAGNRMKTLDWPYPSVVAGSMRTMVGKARGKLVPDELKAIEVAGALPVRGGELYVPTALDCVLRSDPPGALAALPRKEYQDFCNLPQSLYWPTVLKARQTANSNPTALLPLSGCHSCSSGSSGSPGIIRSAPMPQS